MREKIESSVPSQEGRQEELQESGLEQIQVKITEIIEKIEKSGDGVEPWEREEIDFRAASLAAESYEKLGDDVKAREAWRKVAENFESKKAQVLGDDFESRYYDKAAKAYEKAGEQVKAKEMWEKSVEHYSKILSKKPYEAGNLAKSYEKIGNSEKARELWIMQAEHDEARAISSGMIVYYKSAAEIYKQKLGDIPKFKEITEKKAEALLGDKEYERAVDAYLEIAEVVRKS